MDGFWPVSNGLVPGRIQTALRGEILAAISACKFALQSHRPLMLWIGNDLVYKRMCKFQNRPCFFKANQKDCDLWSALYAEVHALGPRLLAVNKVCSHQDLSNACDEFEAWAFAGNAAADSTAENTLLRYHTMFALWQQLQHDIAQIHVLRNHAHKTLIQVGRHAVRTQPPTTPDKQYPERISQEQRAEANLAVPKLEEIPAKYQFTHAQDVLNWIAQLIDPAEPPRCVSWSSPVVRASSK